MYTLVPLLCEKFTAGSSPFLNDYLILAKESECFFHLWLQIKFPLKSIASKGQNHELL